MRKVCHLTSVHSSHDTRIFHKECVSLAAAGYDVYLVAPGTSREEKGVKVVGIGPPSASRLRRITHMAKSVYEKALEIDADIYHLHDPELLPYAVKLKRKGKKVIYDSHENYPAQIKHKQYLPTFIRGAVSLLYYRYETYCVKRLDAVIFPCTIKGKNIFEGRASKVVFIDNLPLLAEFATPEVTDIVKPFSIVYAGGLTHSRGITHLVRAASQAGVKLFLAGNIDSTYHNHLRAMPEYSCVEYVGILNREDLMCLYKSVSVGMATLLKVGQYGNSDNLPTKVLEYMGAGLPVIITDYPFAREVISKYNCGICVSPDNIDEIVDAISYLHQHPTDGIAMGQRGKVAVQKEYNWRAAEVRLLGLYQSI